MDHLLMTPASLGSRLLPDDPVPVSKYIGEKPDCDRQRSGSCQSAHSPGLQGQVPLETDWGNSAARRIVKKGLEIFSSLIKMAHTQENVILYVLNNAF